MQCNTRVEDICLCIVEQIGQDMNLEFLQVLIFGSSRQQ